MCDLYDKLLHLRLNEENTLVTKAVKKTPSTTFNNNQLAIEKYKSHQGWYWSGLIRYPGLMISSWILMIINAVITILPGILLGVAIDILRVQGYGQLFIILTISIVIAALVGWGLTFLSSYLWGLASYRFERDIRQEFFNVVQEHSMAFHDVNDSGVLLSMGMNETAQIRFSYNPSLRHLLNSFLSIILTCVYFFIRLSLSANYTIGVGSWEIGLIVSFSFVLYLILAWRYANRIGPIRRERAIELGNVSSATQEVFRGIEVVRSFDNEEVEKKKFSRISEQLAEKSKIEGYMSSFYWPALIMIIVTAGSFAYGLWMVSNNSGLTYGQLASMLTLLLQLVSLNFMIPTRLLMLQAGRINAKRIWDVMNFDDPLVEPKKSKEADWSKDLQFDNVWFKYPGTDKFVLKDVSFNIPNGS